MCGNQTAASDLPLCCSRGTTHPSTEHPSTPEPHGIWCAQRQAQWKSKTADLGSVGGYGGVLLAGAVVDVALTSTVKLGRESRRSKSVSRMSVHTQSQIPRPQVKRRNQRDSEQRAQRSARLPSAVAAITSARVGRQAANRCRWCEWKEPLPPEAASRPVWRGGTDVNSTLHRRRTVKHCPDIVQRCG
jgi:hypothetical protein